MENLQDPQALIDRVTHLERQNRRMSWALLGLAALALAGLTSVTVAAAAAPAVVEASQFILKDDDGSKRGEIVVGPGGGGRVLLYGRDGRLIAELPMRTQMLPVKP
jgi:hypothetical protein